MPNDTPRDPVPTIADLQHELAQARAERDEALAQQTATTEVLQVINSSPGDLLPVFDAMLDKATQLCEAETGVLWTYHGDQMEASAILGATPEYDEYLRAGPRPLSLGHQRLLHGGRVLQIDDVEAHENYRSGQPMARALFDLGRVRTILLVPLLKEDTLLGAFAVYRQEVRPFSDKQIALLQNFAAQAVIAMENARLITETREALEQQTATAEVLQVINSSPGDLAPVFNAMLEKALNLCGAAYGSLLTYDGELFHVAATVHVHGEVNIAERYRQRPPFAAGPGTLMYPIVRGEEVVFVEDVLQHDAYRRGGPFKELVDSGGFRSVLDVALRKEGALLGLIAIHRQEVRPFSDKQIALLQNFAAQAVIAMENARLITETREALEQQTATAEVLQVINSSPGDLAPVFDAILEKAHALCDSGHGTLFLREGEHFRAAAMRGVPEPLAERLRQGQLGLDAPAILPLLAGEPLVHITDLTRSEHPMARAALAGGVRTLLSVPLSKGDALVGLIVAGRLEARPFTEKQIALLQNFAAQAVIAMENARLITETREALEQQTATAEVLGVINSSPGDLAPVFDAMLEKALRLCEGTFGNLLSYDGEFFRIAAAAHGDGRVAERLLQRPPFAVGATDNALCPVLRGDDLVFVADVRELYGYRTEPMFQEMVDSGGYRSLLNVALRKDGILLGVIGIFRDEVRPFTDKQIALLQNFAAQAVIAIENARLITETREALEQQTATAEVLQVINSSPGDLAPVFDAMLDKAMRLCAADFGMLQIEDGDRFRTAATHGVPPAFAEYRRNHAFVAGPGSLGARIVAGERVVHIPDLKDDEPYRAGDGNRQAMVDLGGARTGLAVPLTRDGRPLGFIIIYRQEVRPFSDKQIALLQNFAAQAVIAIENARLLGELRPHR